MDNPCEHAWQYNKPAHASASVRICSLCHTIDGEELMRTLDEYAEERASRDDMKDPEPDPLDDARRLLAEDQQRRLEACQAEIEQVLAKHGMRLQITQPQISIVPT
jgi:hypothetical protein